MSNFMQRLKIQIILALEHYSFRQVVLVNVFGYKVLVAVLILDKCELIEDSNTVFVDLHPRDILFYFVFVSFLDDEILGFFFELHFLCDLEGERVLERDVILLEVNVFINFLCEVDCVGY